MFEFLRDLCAIASGGIGDFLDFFGVDLSKHFRLRWIVCLPVILVFLVLVGLTWLFHLLSKIW